MNERRPRGNEWVMIGASMPVRDPMVLASSVWQSGPIRVCTALEQAEYPDGDGAGPQWHISITTMGKRPKPNHVRRALRAFDLVGAEEDNHEPGNARHFWLPVDPAHRVDCQCKEDEEVIVDPDGYTWTNPRPESGEECRGCAIAPVTGRPCPIHEATS